MNSELNSAHSSYVLDGSVHAPKESSNSEVNIVLADFVGIYNRSKSQCFPRPTGYITVVIIRVYLMNMTYIP